MCGGIPDMDGNGVAAESGKSTCSGDSGGPVICDVNGKYVLTGITSYGVGCAMRGYPTFFHRVHYSLRIRLTRVFPESFRIQ